MAGCLLLRKNPASVGFFCGWLFFSKREAQSAERKAQSAKLVSLLVAFTCGLAGLPPAGTRREPRSAVRPSRWRLGVQSHARQCLASNAPSPLGARGRHPWRPTVPAGGKPASPDVVSLTDGGGTAGLCFFCWLGRDGCGWLVCLDGLDGFLFWVGIGWFGAADQRSALPPNLPMNSPPNLPTYLSTHPSTYPPAGQLPATNQPPTISKPTPHWPPAAALPTHPHTVGGWCGWVGGTVGRHGWRPRASRDGFTACPANPPAPTQPTAPRRRS